MTVSRVINRRDNVGADTRERVEAAVRELNYAPNPAASSLARAQAVRIALLYGNPSAAYLGAFLVGGLEQCRQSNLQLIVEQCANDEEAEAVAQRLIAGGIDGIILPPPLCDSQHLVELLEQANMPAAAVATDRPTESLSTIGIDDCCAAQEMTAHLIALGHRRIGFISGHPQHSASGRRLTGYRQALEDADIEFDAALVVPGWFTYRSGLDAAEQLLELEPRPTAIFASNDDMAAASVAVAHRRGLDIPADLTVCGFDDTAMATMIDPELTTIRQPIGEMAAAAVRLLIDEIRWHREGKAERHPHTVIGYTLVRRQSDAAPRQRPRVPRLQLPQSALK